MMNARTVFNLNPIFQTNNSEMLFDDECYLMPEEIGIPQHVQRVLKSPSFPIDSSRTLPHLSQIRNPIGFFFKKQMTAKFFKSSDRLFY